jgi:hypothetical protein
MSSSTNIGGVDLTVYGVPDVGTRNDPAILPGGDQTLTAQTGEMFFELIAQILVRVRIRKEQAGHVKSSRQFSHEVPRASKGEGNA